jgi:four helix bundle protein
VHPLQKVITMADRTIRSFRDLDTWQAGMDLVVAAYDVAGRLPASERFELGGQMRRAAVSVPSNVAEGHAFRSSAKAFARHVRIALGSIAELETCFEIAVRLHHVDEQTLTDARANLARTGQLLHGLLRSLRRRAEANKQKRR